MRRSGGDRGYRGSRKEGEDDEKVTGGDRLSMHVFLFLVTAGQASTSDGRVQNRAHQHLRKRLRPASPRHCQSLLARLHSRDLHQNDSQSSLSPLRASSDTHCANGSWAFHRECRKTGMQGGRAGGQAGGKRKRGMGLRQAGNSGGGDRAAKAAAAKQKRVAGTIIRGSCGK